MHAFDAPGPVRPAFTRGSGGGAHDGHAHTVCTCAAAPTRPPVSTPGAMATSPPTKRNFWSTQQGAAPC
jgi:hypothetical protein